MVECNRGCGAMDLHWKAVNGKYKLFSHNDLLHICNDGQIAEKKTRENATARILTELKIKDPALIPMADTYDADKDCENYHAQVDMEAVARAKDPSKMFTINSTANGIAITGDDKHNAIYLPKIAVSELAKALMDFIL